MGRALRPPSRAGIVRPGPAPPQVGPTLLLIEQLPPLVAERAKAIQDLKIDQITAWDQGAGGTGRAD